MRDLPLGAEFRLAPQYGNPTRYRVTLPANEHKHGWVEVRNLSMTAAEAASLLATAPAVDPGQDPRDGVFIDGQLDAAAEVLL